MPWPFPSFLCESVLGLCRRIISLLPLFILSPKAALHHMPLTFTRSPEQYHFKHFAKHVGNNTQSK